MGVGGWDEVFEREAKVTDPEAGRRMRRGAQGTWVVRGMSRSGRAHSGTHLVSNKWGDTSMGTRFDYPSQRSVLDRSCPTQGIRSPS